MSTSVQSSAVLKVELDAANAKAAQLLKASLRSGKGPSPEYKAAYQAARLVWRKWSNALDVEQGRAPAFPV